MGNYISCALSIPRAAGIPAAKLLLPTGELLHVSSSGGAHAAAEFMLDYPGSFLVSAASLRLNRRFDALSADEDIEPGGVYVIFPMGRLNSVVAAADLARLLGKAATLARVAPAGPAPVPETRGKLEEMDEEVAAEVRARLGVSRSKKPMLATIVEENSNFF